MNIFKEGLSFLKGKKSDAKKLGDTFSKIAKKVGTEGCETPQALAEGLRTNPVIKEYYLKNIKVLKKFSIAGAFITTFINMLNEIELKDGEMPPNKYRELCKLFLLDSKEKNMATQMVQEFKKVDNGEIGKVKTKPLNTTISDYYKKVNYEDNKKFGKDIKNYASNMEKEWDKGHVTLVRSVLTYKDACEGIADLLDAISNKWGQKEVGVGGENEGANGKKVGDDGKKAGVVVEEVGADDKEVDADDKEVGADDKEVGADDKEVGADGEKVDADDKEVDDISEKTDAGSEKASTDSGKVSVNGEKASDEKSSDTNFNNAKHSDMETGNLTTTELEHEDLNSASASERLVKTYMPQNVLQATDSQESGSVLSEIKVLNTAQSDNLNHDDKIDTAKKVSGNLKPRRKQCKKTVPKKTEKHDTASEIISKSNGSQKVSIPDLQKTVIQEFSSGKNSEPIVAKSGKIDSNSKNVTTNSTDLKNVAAHPDEKKSDAPEISNEVVKDPLAIQSVKMSHGDSQNTQNKESVVIGDGMSCILGSVTNQNRDKLINITISESVTEIDLCAFSGCKNLKTVFIPESVVTIGAFAFYACASLETINVPNSVKKIGRYAFEECENLVKITLPESVTEIKSFAFKGCAKLESITILGNVKKIEENTFEGCENLAKIDLPKSVEEIENNAFDKCVSLTNVTIPKNVKKIGMLTFNNCKNLTNVTIPENVTTIGYGAFNSCTNLKTVVIPESVKEIEGSTFAECVSLTDITIPKNVTKIGEWSFNNCKSLKTVVIPEGVTEIGKFAFDSCTNLTSITIPKSIKHIEKCFYGCESIVVHFNDKEYRYDNIEELFDEINGNQAGQK